jgi:hypothetical protein
MHDYTGVTGFVTTGGSIVGYVEADFTLEKDTGERLEQGSDQIAAHTRGLRRASGKLKRAWGTGMDSKAIYDWFEQDEEKIIVFDPGDTAATYTISGAAITKINGAIKAGDEGALELDADFKGLGWSSTDTDN